MGLRAIIDPSYVKSRAIGLELARPLDLRRTLTPIAITVTPIGDALTYGGLVVPLVLEVTPPSAASGARRMRFVYRRIVPVQFTFIPHEGGQHLVVLSELYHNRFTGSLLVDVAGEALRP